MGGKHIGRRIKKVVKRSDLELQKRSSPPEYLSNAPASMPNLPANTTQRPPVNRSTTTAPPSSHRPAAPKTASPVSRRTASPAPDHHRSQHPAAGGRTSPSILSNLPIR